MAKEKIPLTRFQRGRRWATWTLVTTGLFSIWFNVRSGRFEAEPILISGMPVVVLFLTIHLVTYLNPRKGWHKGLVYFGLGLVILVAFGMSGYHLYMEALRNGQPLLIALTYPFIVDVPSTISAVILIERVPVAQNSPQQTNQAKKTVPTKQNNPPKKSQPVKRTQVAKTTIPPFSNPLDDPREREMLTA